MSHRRITLQILTCILAITKNFSFSIAAITHKCLFSRTCPGKLHLAFVCRALPLCTVYITLKYKGLLSARVLAGAHVSSELINRAASQRYFAYIHIYTVQLSVWSAHISTMPCYTSTMQKGGPGAINNQCA